MTQATVLLISLVLFSWIYLYLWRSLQSQATCINALPGPDELSRQLSNKYSGLVLIIDPAAHPHTCRDAVHIAEFLKAEDCGLLTIDGPSIVLQRPELVPLLSMKGFPALLLIHEGYPAASCMLFPDNQFVPRVKQWFRQTRHLLRTES